MAWDLAKGWTVHQIPSSLPPLFSGDRLVVFGVLKAPENANEGGENEVRLEAVLEKGEKIEHLMKFPTPRIDVENKGNVLLHQLAAKSFIQEKQDDHSERHDSGQEFETTKTSIISISKSANVVSKFTSFVAVDQDSNQPVSGPLGKQFVPLSTSGYQSVALYQVLSLQGARLDSICANVQSCGVPLKKAGLSFGSSSPKLKSSSSQKGKSKGFFSSLFGSSAPPSRPPAGHKAKKCAPPRENIKGFSELCAPPPPPALFADPSLDMDKSPCPPPAPGSMTQKKQESPAAMSVSFYDDADEEMVRYENCGSEEVLGGALPARNKAKGVIGFSSPGSMSQKKKESPTAMSVISLQKASGSWDLTDKLVSLCGISRDALIKGCPKEIAVDTGEGKLLWATALALVLLMGKFTDQKDEWEMIAEKGTKWMKKNLPAGVKYENVLEAAATTVGVKIKS